MEDNGSVSEGNITWKDIEKAQIKIMEEGFRLRYRKDSKFIREYAGYVSRLRQEENPDEYVRNVAIMLFPDEEAYNIKIARYRKCFFRINSPENIEEQDKAVGFHPVFPIKYFFIQYTYAMVFIKTLVEEKYVVTALIETTSHFSTISKELFDKLRTDHGIGRVTKIIKRYNKDAVGEINCLDIQVLCKEKYRKLNFTEAIDFIIVKSPKYPLVLGQSWLSVHNVNIDLYHYEISLYGMHILFLDEEEYFDDDLYYEFRKPGRSLPKSTPYEKEYESSSDSSLPEQNSGLCPRSE
ncbi:unnamed protein product [Rhizophagus irregularis]|nr:unnamed protein product [Rhizophagus irregularis]CAB5369928.1 unnamed protein product [Rhizophagus irregularis]